jgi:hypothetical protein
MASLATRQHSCSRSIATTPNGFSILVNAAGNKLARASKKAVGRPKITGHQSPAALPRETTINPNPKLEDSHP